MMLAPLRSTVMRAVTEAKDSHRHLPEVLSNREVLIRWLKDARSAQVAFGITVLGGLFLGPPLIDGLLGLVLPSSSEQSGFLGMSRRTVQSPLAEPLSWILILLYWATGLFATVVLLWREIPLQLKQSAGGDKTMIAPSIVQGAQDPSGISTSATVIGDSAASGRRNRGEHSERLSSHTSAPTRDLADRYTITRQLGEGGMGQVFLALDQTLGREVALKKLPPELVGNEGMRERFRREARALAQLNHAHVVQLYDFLEDGDGSMWMVMEVVSGGDLEQKMEGRRLPSAEVFRLGVQMADALGAAHRRGIVHRDFKPANVMLNEAGDAKVTDFGIAKLEAMSAQSDTKLTQAGVVMGTPTYMSPEQALGIEVGPPSDVYSLGAALYEMFTGEPLFRGTLTQVIAAHVTQPPDPFSARGAELPEEAERLVFAMLKKKPEERPSVEEVSAALTSLLPGN